MKTENYKSAVRLLASFAYHICTHSFTHSLSGRFFFFFFFFFNCALFHTLCPHLFHFILMLDCIRCVCVSVCLCMQACISVLICEQTHKIHGTKEAFKRFFNRNRWLLFFLFASRYRMEWFFSFRNLFAMECKSRNTFRLVTRSFVLSISMDCVNRIQLIFSYLSISCVSISNI